ncbi:hypothetical protein B484DRAFT_440139, partial [Ochromonadaceae sp. CCMP2298]
MWAPGMSYSMTSVSALDTDGKLAVFGGGRCLVLDTATRDKILSLVAEQPAHCTVMTGTLSNRLYHVDAESAAPGESPQPPASTRPLSPARVKPEPYVFARNRAEIMGSQGTLRPGSTAGLNPLQLLHLRTGHASKKTILAGLLVNAYRGAQTTYEACKSLEIGPCDPCMRATERQRHISPSSSRDFTKLLPMQEIGLDPVKLSTTAIGGENYVNFAHCYGTRMSMGVATKAEGNQVSVIKAVQRAWCSPYQHVIKKLHTDYGSIYHSGE